LHHDLDSMLCPVAQVEMMRRAQRLAQCGHSIQLNRRSGLTQIVIGITAGMIAREPAAQGSMKRCAAASPPESRAKPVCPFACSMAGTNRCAPPLPRYDNARP